MLQTDGGGSGCVIKLFQFSRPHRGCVCPRRWLLMRYLGCRTPESAPDVVDLDPVAPYGMFFGRPLREWPATVTVRVTRLSHIPDVWWVGAYLLASRKCLSVLRGLGETSFEEFPIALVDSRGRRDPDALRILNLLGNISCVDTKHSRFEADEDGIIRRFLDCLSTSSGSRRIGTCSDSPRRRRSSSSATPAPRRSWPRG